jgi:hypothetical protein
MLLVTNGKSINVHVYTWTVYIYNVYTLTLYIFIYTICLSDNIQNIKVTL